MAPQKPAKPATEPATPEKKPTRRPRPSINGLLGATPPTPVSTATGAVVPEVPGPVAAPAAPEAPAPTPPPVVPQATPAQAAPAPVHLPAVPTTPPPPPPVAYAAPPAYQQQAPPFAGQQMPAGATTGFGPPPPTAKINLSHETRVYGVRTDAATHDYLTTTFALAAVLYKLPQGVIPGVAAQLLIDNAHEIVRSAVLKVHGYDIGPAATPSGNGQAAQS